MELLRELPGRRVWRDGDSLVKAFRHPSVWMRWRDGVRARRELAVLRALRARGLPVPEPLGFERIDRAACARLAWIPDAPTLEQRLDASEIELAGARDEAERRAVLARRHAWLRATARALARFSAEGLRQPDWHPKNALVDARGEVFVIDLHKARLGPPTARVVLDGARRFASLLFERTTRGELARAAHAWWDALPEALRDACGDGRAVRRRLAVEARAERREQVERDLDRWLRASGAVRVVSGTGSGTGRGSGTETGAPAALVARDTPWTARATTRATTERSVAEPSTATLELRGSRRALEHAWIVQARLVEHRVPAARPLRLERDAHGDARATFALDAGASSFAPRGVEPLALLAERLGAGPRATALVRTTRTSTRAFTDADGALHLVPRDAAPDRA